MRTPSRRMPPAPERPEMGPFGVAIFLLVALAGPAGLIWWYWPASLIALEGIVVAIFLASAVSEPHDRPRAADRPGESICTFVRALDYRAIDTWIIRAVYEELNKDWNLPIRPSDRFSEDFGIVDEDLDDLAEVAAYRCGRSLEDTASNPMADKVVTVRDLILFLGHQPRLLTS